MGRTGALCLLLGVGVGCGSDDECAPREIALGVSVDGRSVGACGSWELQVRACTLGGACSGPCGACTGSSPEDSCEPIDACETPRIELPPGEHRLCVKAVLVNGGLEFDGQCGNLEVPASGEIDPPQMPIDTDGAFPCIRDWTFEGGQCCNEMFGCVPP